MIVAKVLRWSIPSWLSTWSSRSSLFRPSPWSSILSQWSSVLTWWSLILSWLLSILSWWLSIWWWWWHSHRCAQCQDSQTHQHMQHSTARWWWSWWWKWWWHTKDGDDVQFCNVYLVISQTFSKEKSSFCIFIPSLKYANFAVWGVQLLRDRGSKL